MKRNILMPLLTVFCLPAVLLGGGAGDVTIRTSHPQYPGEGAFQTVEDCVAFATEGKSEPQDKALGMYNWFLTHQWHLMSPMEWCVPGRCPDTADAGDYETVVFDANRARFSYGYGLCGTTHAWNEVYWKALGFGARRREFPNHINSEIFYNNEWHAFDSDMAGLVFRGDGVVAGYKDLQNNPKLVEDSHPPIPRYPFAWPSDFETMKQGWQEVAQRTSWYSLYNGGYAAHPGIVHLREGESFTRWYDRDHYGGPSGRRFWQNQTGGPERKWTFFNTDKPFHDGEKSNSRNLATYCNGEFVYVPPLHSERCRDAVDCDSGSIGFRESSPLLYSKDGKAASVTFRHFSPYVICGDPADDANPMSGTATDGLVVNARIAGTIRCQVSANQGQSWSDVTLLPVDGAAEEGLVRADLTEFVKGRYGWWLKFLWDGESGIDELKFTTTTQVNQAMYPRLTENGCEVQYQTTPRAVVAMIPDFGLEEDLVDKFESPAFRSANLQYRPRSVKNRYAYQATDRNPAEVCFRLDSPGVLQEVIAAVRYPLPVPPTAGCDFRLEVSTDAGSSWQQFAKADIPSDNEFSSGWLYGKIDVSSRASKQALVRVRMHTPGRPAALIDARLYGVHEVAAPGEVSVEFGWLQDGKPISNKTELAAGVTSASLFVPTGGKIVDRFVKIEASSPKMP